MLNLPSLSEDSSLVPFLILGTVLGVVLTSRYARLGLFLVLLFVAVGWGVHTRRYLAAVLFGSVLVRIGVILLDTKTGLLFDPPISHAHHGRAALLADGWRHGVLSPLPDGVHRVCRFCVDNIDPMRRLVAYFLAPFYVVFGPWEIAGRIAVACYGTALGYLSFRIARQIASYRIGVCVAGAVVFWPSILIRSVVIQREVLVAGAMLTVVWLSLRWLDDIQPGELLALLVAVSVIFVLRKENLAVVAITLGTMALIRSRNATKYVVVSGILSLPFFAYFALNFGQFTGIGRTLSPETLDMYAHARDHGDAAYLLALHYDTWVDVVAYAPLKVVYFLFSPLPWQIDNVPDLLAGLSGFGVLIAMILAEQAIGLVKEYKAELSVLFAYAGSGILAYAIVEMNYGAAFRRRIQFIPIVLVFAIIALSRFHVVLSDGSR